MKKQNTMQENRTMEVTGTMEESRMADGTMECSNRALQLVAPNAVQQGDFIEAHFPNGEIERGIAVKEAKPDYHCRYRNKQRMMLCENGEKRGHIITGCAGFPDGTKFYRVSGVTDVTAQR